MDKCFYQLQMIYLHHCSRIKAGLCQITCTYIILTYHMTNVSQFKIYLRKYSFIPRNNFSTIPYKRISNGCVCCVMYFKEFLNKTIQRCNEILHHQFLHYKSITNESSILSEWVNTHTFLKSRASFPQLNLHVQQVKT
jgi:hypothetical protein